MFDFILSMWSWLPSPLPVLFDGMFLIMVVIVLWKLVAGILELAKVVLML